MKPDKMEGLNLRPQFLQDESHTPCGLFFPNGHSHKFHHILWP